MSEEDGGAFSGCRSLTNITIPNSVTTIADCAFRNCSALTSISIPSSVTTIGRYAFQGCIGLTSINISSGDISIGYNAFQNCSSLTSIDIPNGIKTIEAGLFMNCINLKSVSLPNSVTKISNISENSVINGAFYGCQSLEKIILSDNLSAIEAETFMYCSKLSSITIPNTVTFIGDRAFYGCSSLKSLSVPSKVASIGEQAFWNCNKLITIDFSEGIISLKKSCFERCDNLKNVVIPSSVEAIYQSAFRDCNKLEYVKVLSETPPFLYDDSFSNYTIPLKVPRGCKEAYQGAPGWKNFVSISDADKYRLTYVVDSKEYKVYEIEEGTTITQEPAPTKEGYTFSGWSEIPETMPAHDVIVTGIFTINKFKLTYMIDDVIYKETIYEYGATITPEPQPEGDYATFEWTDLPQTMPAHDVVVYANYTSGIIEVLMTRQGNIRIYSPNGKKQDKLQKGLNIMVLDDGTVKKVVVK